MTQPQDWSSEQSSADPRETRLTEPIGEVVDQPGLDEAPLPPLDPAGDGGAHAATSGGSGGGASDQAKQAAGTAKEQAADVAGTAKVEAASVAAEAKDKAAGLVDEARQQVQEQSRTQLQALSSRLGELGDELASMADASDQQGAATELAQQLATQVRSLGRHLDGRDPSAVLDDVRSFARNRPGTFLLGAAAAGVVAGRLARGAKASPSTGGQHAAGPGTTTTGTGTGGVTA